MTGLTNPTHIALLFLIALLLFGAKRLPEIGRSLGTGMREFKNSVTGENPSETPELALGPGNLSESPSGTATKKGAA